MNEAFGERVAAWIVEDPDPADREEIASLLATGQEEELHRRFDAPLTFGTAGLRGREMAGPSGMNRFTVRRTTQGVVAWLHEIDAEIARGVVVGRDARHGSERFNDEVVAVLLGAGVTVIEMPSPLPTPMVAYAVKAVGAVAGIMITASHNPPEDNGYKLYGADGAQIIPPDDSIVEGHATRATPAHLGDRSSDLHHYLDSAVLDRYRKHFTERFGAPSGRDLAITYTPLHGVGGATMLRLFNEAGYGNVTAVPEQFAPDPDFPTLAFPNPEEPGALDRAMALADSTGSRLVVANDPDADRLGAAVRGPGGWRVLKGDEIGWLLASSLLASPKAPGNVVATTIVSSTMLESMAMSSHVDFARTLTGFKWISRAAPEGVLRFGYEEALGYAVDPLVADKDGLSAALALCQLAYELDRVDQSLFDRLDEIEILYGVHGVDQLSIRVEDRDSGSPMNRALGSLRDSPPERLGEETVSDVIDLSRGWRELPATEGLVLQLGTSGRVVVRPSGTESKLKVYFEVTSPPDPRTSLQVQRDRVRRRLAALHHDVELLLSF